MTVKFLYSDVTICENKVFTYPSLVCLADYAGMNLYKYAVQRHAYKANTEQALIAFI